MPPCLKVLHKRNCLLFNRQLRLTTDPCGGHVIILYYYYLFRIWLLQLQRNAASCVLDFPVLSRDLSFRQVLWPSH